MEELMESFSGNTFSSGSTHFELCTLECLCVTAAIKATKHICGYEMKIYSVAGQDEMAVKE